MSLNEFYKNAISYLQKFGLMTYKNYKNRFLFRKSGHEIQNFEKLKNVQFIREPSVDNTYFNFLTSIVGVFIAMFGEKVRRIFSFYIF